MKKIIIFITLILFSVTTLYAANTLLKSEEVTYDNSTSKGTSDNVQGAIDELYKKAKTASGEMDTLWKEPILNGAYPELAEGLIPVTIDDDGKVKYASLYTKWYSYENKRWANAVILKNTSKKYTTGDTISEENIESYFVWVPRYKYRIWNDGNYTKAYTTDDIKDDNSELLTRYQFENTRIIDIVFEDKTKAKSNGNAVGAYLTHPAFTLAGNELNGIWVGKFETGSDNGSNTGNIIIKPNVSSMRSLNIHDAFMKALNYNRTFDSHMMKNTEWGAVAYLSHSLYGIGTEIRVNNNSGYITGYAAALNTNENSFRGLSDNSDSGLTLPYNTPEGTRASTTGNISGIYDMSGGAIEYVAAYVDESGASDTSGFSKTELTTYKNYFDVYSSNSIETSYNNRILGDATGEMGPFLQFKDADGTLRPHSVWYANYTAFVRPSNPWFTRGGRVIDGMLAGIFYFNYGAGGVSDYISFRTVLSIK